MYMDYFLLGYSTYTNPLLSTVGVASNIRKTYDDLDLIVGGRYGPRPLTPTSPLTGNWGLEGYAGLDGVNPTFLHTQQQYSRLGPLDLESKIYHFLLLWVELSLFNVRKIFQF